MVKLKLECRRTVTILCAKLYILHVLFLVSSILGLSFFSTDFVWKYGNEFMITGFWLLFTGIIFGSLWILLAIDLFITVIE